jgi:Baseplate J-like protein
LILSSAPKIDLRSAADVAQQMQQLLKVYAPGWNEVDPVTGAPKGVSAALIGVSAHFAEVLIQRLNQVPQKNFLAFLELLGAALLPPQPARVPVTFLVATGSLVDAVVPAGTQIAAPPGPGEKEPVIYETENELVVATAQPALAIVRDPEEDTYADYSNDIVVTGSSGTPVFHGNKPIAHILYLGQSQFLNSPGISSLSLILDLQPSAGDDLNLKWEIWNSTEWQDITPDPANDGTNNLRQSGTIKFERTAPAKVPAAQATTVGGIIKEWIRCRLLTPITRSSAPRSGMIRAGQLPQIRSVGMRVHLHNEGLPIDEASSSSSDVIDLSKAFYPFGEKPKLNDTLSLALEEAFNAGTTVTLNVQVTTAPGLNTNTPPPAAPSDDLKLRWEVWNGVAWVELGTSTKTGPVATVVNGNSFLDTTNAFSQDGTVAFTLPSNVRSSEVNGKERFWIRVRITAGNYGVEGYYKGITPVPDPPASPFKFFLPTFQPPSISSLTAMYDLDKPAPPQTQTLPEAVLAYNDSIYTDLTAAISQAQGFSPFHPSPDLRPTLYLGFVLSTGRTTFPNNTITMFFHGADLQYGEKTIPLAPDVSRGAGDPNTNVIHKFVVTNPRSSGIIYTPNLLSSQWTPVITIINSDGSPGGTSPSKIPVPSGDWVEVDVQVKVPHGTSFGARDDGILQLVSPDQVLYTAEFVTFAHDEQVQTQQLQLTWEYWSGQAWTTLVVRDETSNLTTTGIVEFLAPQDFAAHTEFGTNAWWLRVRWDSGDYDTDPRINRIFLNTTLAAQNVTVRNEVLGSSDGNASQSFQTTRAPVLSGQTLAVRELEAPSGDELKTILEDEGKDAVLVIRDSSGKPSEIWVTWHEVPDFYASDSHSRHYTLDHITGQVSFGDGLSGMIPPVGSANIRLGLYKTGGGVRGNRPAESIVQLKTTVPYIDKVTNYLEATGGVDAESMDSLVSRAPTEIRHRHRAVTKEDYEDLAHLASTDVARALCVSNRDLVADPFDDLPPVLGNVSLIVVPNTTDTKPQPSIELIHRVQKFISTSSPVTATVLVVGPLYLRVAVQTEIGLASLDGAGTVPLKVQDALAAFLHPLTGGFDGKGWEFGREPHRSDFYRVVEEIPEVDHIRTLTVQSTEDFPGSRKTGRFLVYSGTHSINLVFEP